MVEFRKAGLQDALTIIRTRQKVWDATYRGIYPDDVIDHFDYDWHLQAEQNRLRNNNFHCFMVMDGSHCVGYYSYGPVRKRFRMHSLYLLPAYRKNGLGRQIFEQVKSSAIEAGFDGMYLDCHPDNHNALGFYLHMGGIITDVDTGHENRQEDNCTVEYHW